MTLELRENLIAYWKEMLFMLSLKICYFHCYVLPLYKHLNILLLSNNKDAGMVKIGYICRAAGLPSPSHYIGILVEHAVKDGQICILGRLSSLHLTQLITCPPVVGERIFEA